VHGIAAVSAGGSRVFQKAICAFLKDCAAPAAPTQRDYADSGEFALGADPPAFAYLDRPVWRSKEEWSAAAPFVDHYVIRRRDGGPLVLDEINWWPLALAVKCRGLVAGETRMAGPNRPLLDFCSQAPQPDPDNAGRFRAYRWISSPGAQRLKAAPARGALINRWFKNSTLDWGFSDAMMAVGSMHDVLREGMRQLFLKSVTFGAEGAKAGDGDEQLNTPHGADQEFIVVSHSLGSYLVFTTLNLGRRGGVAPSAPAPAASGAAAEDAAVQYILERTSLVYFFANQVPLLELANLQAPGARVQAPSPEGTPGALDALMMEWRNLRAAFARQRGGTEVAKPPQVIAWSDPSDLLSWRLPSIDGLVITNLYVRNTAWHWIIANPAAAHANYATNKEVLKIMFGPKPARPEGQPVDH
jgi:hypothetical protein